MSEIVNNDNNSKSVVADAGTPDTGKVNEQLGQIMNISLNPSNMPLNHIDNLREWENVLEEFKQVIKQMQRQLQTALGLTEDKKNEYDGYMDEKISLNVEFQKVSGTLYRKLANYIEFIGVLYDDVKQKLENPQSNCIYDDQLDMLIDYNYDKESNCVSIGIDRELDDDERDQLYKIVLQNLVNDGFSLTSVSVNYNIHDVLDKYLKLIDFDTFDSVLESLDDTCKNDLKKLEKKLRWYVNKYNELGSQIAVLSSLISGVNDYYYGSLQVADDIQQEIDNRVIDINEKSKTYFLNSYLSTKRVKLDSFVSTPIVEKQIKYIIELNKKGLSIPKTILLYGKPNLGKSYAATVLATELGRKMYHIKPYDLFEGGYSDPNEMLDSVFTIAIKKDEPCIIFLDGIGEFPAVNDGGPYQKLVENTIRHHISKIKESSVDIIIIGSISDKNSVNHDLLKQEVFAKQIYFDKLPDDKNVELLKKMLDGKGVSLGNDVDLSSILSGLKVGIDCEYLKKLVENAIDFHRLDNLDEGDIVLSKEDFETAIKHISIFEHNTSTNVGFSS